MAPLLACLILNGCERNDTGEAPAAERPATPRSATPEKKTPASNPTTRAETKKVAIEANDKMKFSVTGFSVETGQPVEVTLKNVGTMPKVSMGHNWVLLKDDAAPGKFVEAGFDDAANDYIDPGVADQIIAATRLLGPGESDTVTFTAPEKAGKYNYVCSFPGHFAAGMKGVMTAE